MDLKVMRYFVSTVKAGSITRAAATLYVTQPTLTRQIHELEEELGHPLLERSRQGISLTPPRAYLLSARLGTAGNGDTA